MLGIVSDTSFDEMVSMIGSKGKDFLESPFYLAQPGLHNNHMSMDSKFISGLNVHFVRQSKK